MSAKPKDDDKLRAEWFWGDRWALSSAKALSIAHRGLYREMLTAAWLLGAKLPKDHADIRRLVGVELKEWNALWPKVSPYWRVDGDFLVNDTQLEIYAEAQRRAEAASSRGKAGADAKWKRQRSQGNAEADAQGNAQGDAQASPAQSPQSQSLIRSSVPAGPQTDAPALAPERPWHPSRPRHGNAFGFRRDATAAWEGPLFNVPAKWFEKVRQQTAGKFSDEALRAFATALTERVQRTGEEVPIDGFLGWLDREASAWLRTRQTDRTGDAAAKATDAFIQRQDAIAAAIPKRTAAEVAALMGRPPRTTEPVS